MKMKKWTAVLLALLLCVQILPVPSFAAGNYSIELDLDGVIGGTAVITPPDGSGATVDGLRVEGLDASETVIVSATAADGYVFKEWIGMYKKSTGSWLSLPNWKLLTTWTEVAAPTVSELSIGIKGVAHGLKLTPVFEAEGSAIQVTPAQSEGGVISASSDLTAVWPGSVLKFTAQANSGYNFGHWEVLHTQDGSAAQEGTEYTLSGSGSSVSLTVMAGAPDLTVKGIFVPFVPVSATVTAQTGSVEFEGAAYRAGQTITFPDNTASVTITARPDEGYQFMRWEITGVDIRYEYLLGDSLTFNLPKEDFSITAFFGRAVSYKVMCEGRDLTDQSNWQVASGVWDIPVALYSFDPKFSFMDAITDFSKRTLISKAQEGTPILAAVQNSPKRSGEYLLDSITVSPEPAPTNFLGKYTDAETSYYAFLMPDDNVTVTANLRNASVVSIQATANDGNMGSVVLYPADTGVFYLEGTTIRMTAVPKEGYRFKEWQESNSSYLSPAIIEKNVVEFEAGSENAEFIAVFEKAGDEQSYPIDCIVGQDGKAVVLINGNAGVSSARAGQTIAVSLGDLDEYYLFDHWEIFRKSDQMELIPASDRTNAATSFIMPNDSSGVSIKAVLRERLIPVTLNAFANQILSSNYGRIQVQVNDGPVMDSVTSISLRKGDVLQFTAGTSAPDRFVVDYVKITSDMSVELYRTNEETGRYTVADWSAGGAEIKTVSISIYLVEKTPENTRYSITVTQPASGGTISVSPTAAKQGDPVTLTANPADGYKVKAWAVTDTANAEITLTPNGNTAVFTMPASNVTATAEFETTAAPAPGAPEITAVELLHNGQPAGTVTHSGTAWTITLPATVAKEDADKISSGAVPAAWHLKITASEGAAVKQVSGGGSYSGDWSGGDIMCWMPLNQAVPFTVSAEDGTTQDYTITIAYTAPGTPRLTASDAVRISDTSATVAFTSSEAGRYYYAVVNAGAAAPTVDTSTGGADAKAGGTNVITLSSLTAGAKDLYIVVKGTAGEGSAPLKITIPAYAAAGTYRVTLLNTTGGTISASKTTAGAGETIVLSAWASNGYYMTSASWSCTRADTKAAVTVTNNTFVMPESDVYVICNWIQSSTGTYVPATSDKLWDELADLYNRMPWWEHAERQYSRSRYPTYW